MANPPDPGSGPHWHQALAYALLGRVEPSLWTQSEPSPAELVADLEARYPGGRAGLLAEIESVRAGVGRTGADRRPWPRPVPEELRTGLGAAQFSAALLDLRRLLELESGPRRTVANRRLDAAEQALLREVPPHH